MLRSLFVVLLEIYLVVSVPVSEETIPGPAEVKTESQINQYPFLEEPEVFADNRSHHLFVGRCGRKDDLIHAETIIINNDGTSRTLGDIKISVQGPVYITCVKVLDQTPEGELSGAYPSYIAGGVAYNYIILGFKTAYGYGARFYVEVYGF